MSTASPNRPERCARQEARKDNDAADFPSASPPIPGEWLESVIESLY